MADERPKLRTDLEFFPVQQGKERFVFIKDILGLAEGKLLPFSLFEVMAQMDGKNSIRDLQVFIMRKSGGMIISKHEVEDLVEKLDKMFLLDSDRYRKEKKKIEEEFLSQKIRPCSHCGKAYPKDPERLKEMIDKIVADGNSPDDNIIALIAPHIDISVGSKVYGKVYREIRDTKFSKVIILGVGHYMSDNLFCLTEKDFEIPLGIIKTDKEAIRMLKKAAPEIISNTDFAHKSEHSIEFQLIFLRHLIKTDFEIIPILCGPVRLFLDSYERATYINKVRPFIEILSNIFSQEQTLLVAGVDLSHIGPKFGHDMPARYLESQAKAHDSALIDALLNKSPERFWEESKRVDDKYNVCGFSAICCFLELIIKCSIPATIKAELLDYEMWFEEATNSAVSFCGMKFLGDF